MVPASDNIIPVAFADNHLSVLETISMFLDAQDDIQVTIKARDGKDLLYQLEQAAALPKVSLVDIMMPRLNGFETVPLLRDRWPDMKIIVLTGFLTEEYMERMVMLGVDSYISKDSHPDEICKAIRSVVTNGVYYNGQYNLQLIRAAKKNSLSLPALTELEKMIMKLIVEDRSYLEIAGILHLTEKSVEAHRSRLFNKLGVNSKLKLALYALQYGYVDVIPTIKREGA